MRFVIDHDLHVHTYISPCSGDDEQTPERVLADASAAGLKTVCLTDHYWDELVSPGWEFYGGQTYERLSSLLPLPKKDGFTFLFGCETEISHDLTIGVGPARYDAFDFINIPLTHFHMIPFTLAETERNSVEAMAHRWVERFDAVLASDLPKHKVGLAHLTDVLMSKTDSSPEGALEMVELIPTEELHRLFAGAASQGIGIELNFWVKSMSPREIEGMFRVYRIAKEEGCKFYFGSDRHGHGDYGEQIEDWEKTIDILGLEESDKYHIGR